MNAGSVSLRTTGALAPLAGILIGALGGAVYCLAALLWPSSVALILAMAATALTAHRRAVSDGRLVLLVGVLGLLIKFNTLMALSAAKLPFEVPANFPLALMMIGGHAVSYALSVFVMSARSDPSISRLGPMSLGLALLLGFGPALLLGVPGLVGLAASVLVGLGLMAFCRFKTPAVSEHAPESAQLATELSFYLGALASWRFV